MEENKINVNKIKVGLSSISMGVLAIQHLVGLFSAFPNVSYIPLSVTFFTIFFGTIGIKETKEIKWVSLITTLIIVLVGCILFYMHSYEIPVSQKVNLYLAKCMFAIIGIAALILCVLYVKRMQELE